MRVTFRPIDNRDCEFLQLPRRDQRSKTATRSRGAVVTVDGRIAVAFDRAGHVIYQDGTESASDLICAASRVELALSRLDRGQHQRMLREQRSASDAESNPTERFRSQQKEAPAE